MDEYQLRQAFQASLSRREISLDIQQIQTFAATVMVFDELKGLIENCRNLDHFDKHKLKRLLERIMRETCGYPF